MPKSPQVKCPPTFAALPHHQLLGYCKQAHTPPQQANIAALRNVLGLGVGAFGAGAVLRSLKELPALLGPAAPSVTTTGASLPVEVSIPRDPVQEERRPNASFLPKFSAMEDMLGQTATGLYDHALKPVLESGFMDPLKTTNPAAKWWQTPAMIGTGLAAGGAGWKLMDWLADKRRDAAGDADLQSAKQEYEDAVRGLHAKTAGLDAAREKMLKQAAPAPGMDSLVKLPTAPNAMRNYGGLSLHMLATLATAAAIPSGMFAYGHARNTSDSKALQEALMARRRAQQLRNPAPPHLVLEPAA